MGKIIIYYYSSNCYYSEEAKKIGIKLLNIPNINIQVELYPIERNDDKKINELKEKYRHYTFPIIIYHNSYNEDLLVGGYNEFQSIINYIEKNKNVNLQDYKKSIIINNGKLNGKLRLTYYLLKKYNRNINI